LQKLRATTVNTGLIQFINSIHYKNLYSHDEYDPTDPEKTLDNPVLGSSFCSTCSFSSYRATYQRNWKFCL